ncbi:MAG: hypothetical protein U0103_04695 [Candidatus Obscuribacterales bacterium]
MPKPGYHHVTVVLKRRSYARVEVDTGSGALILDERYMRELGVFKDSMDVKKVEGIDETGHSYVRYFTKLPEDVFLAQSRLFTQKKPKVQFRKSFTMD